MIPGFCLTRLNHRFNTMPCSTPCAKCTCESPCGHLDYSDDFPFEADRTALGVQQDKWLNSPSTYFERLCSTDPSAPECRIYED